MRQDRRGDMAKTATRFVMDENAFKAQLFERVAKEQTKRLVAYAEQELVNMVTTHEFTNRTKNLEDSYVWGVFYKGGCVKFGFYGAKQAQQPSYMGGEKIKGRSLASQFIKSYSPSGSGWEVVWAAMAPYSASLEKGDSPRKRTFYVISQRYDYINNVFKGKCRLEVNAPKITPSTPKKKKSKNDNHYADLDW